MARIFGVGTLKIAGFLVGLPVAIIAGHMAGTRIESAKIRPDEVEKVLKEDPESTVIPLEKIVQVEAKRAYLVTAYLTIQYNTPQGPSASSFIFGSAAKNQKELVEAIREAKRNLARKSSEPQPERPREQISQHKISFDHHLETIVRTADTILKPSSLPTL